MSAAAPSARSRWASLWSSAGPLLLIVLAVSGLVQGAHYWQGQAQGQVLRSLAKPGDILMISSERCVFCSKARAWLDAQRVPYRECFIEREAECAALYRAHLAAGTPTFVLKGQHRVLGFDKERISQLLARP